MNPQDIDNKIQQGIETYMRNKQFNLSKIPAHEHNGVDTVYISAVNLPAGTPVLLGLGGMVSVSNSDVSMAGSANEEIITGIVAGKDINGAVVGTQTNNLQFNLIHYPQSPLNQSFVTAIRPPIFGSPKGSLISVTAGGNTVTINDYSFPVNSLANAYIDIYDSTGAFIETQVIASNTNSIITISGTWINSTNGTYLIFQPVYLGSADTPWQRLYVCDGIGGGIRFGGGPTNGGQNVLLYTDPTTGALMVRDLAGNSSPVGGSGSTKAGKINADGTAGTVFPAGWTVSKTAAGTYTVVHNLGTTAYVITATAVNVSQLNAVVGIMSNSFQILIENTITGVDTDAACNFIFSQ